MEFNHKLTSRNHGKWYKNGRVFGYKISLNLTVSMVQRLMIMLQMDISIGWSRMKFNLEDAHLMDYCNWYIRFVGNTLSGHLLVMLVKWSASIRWNVGTKWCKYNNR